jgi:4-amino-4-deoxy-L-arabinose transferase-like glycosyltransferase
MKHPAPSEQSLLRRYLARPWFATHALILGFALVHLVLASTLPLIAFETHYALYGMHLDWSYVDHPPMVGWIQALVQQFSVSDFAMRLAPIIITTCSQYLVVLLALRLFPAASPWLGFITLLLLQGAVIIHLSVAMAPEIPLLLAGLLVLWFTCDVLQHDRLRDWLGLGLVLGLAGLSKYTAITLAVSVLLALWSGGRLAALRERRAWIGLGLAGLLVSPVLIWNALNDWVSFRYQIGYQMDAEQADVPWSLADALNMQLEQLGAYSPALYIGGIAAVFWSLRRPGGSAGLLMMFALPILLLFSYMAGSGRTSAHWTLLGWVFLAPLAALWLLTQWRYRVVRGLVYVSASISVLVLLLMFILPLPFLPFADYQHPLSRLLGWQQATARAEALREEMAAEGGAEPVLLVYNWHYAGPLAWYGKTLTVQDTEGRPSQYQRWYGQVDAGTRGILVVFDEKDEQPQVYEAGFDCWQVDKLPVYRGSTLARMFYFYRCEPDNKEAQD